MRRVGLLMAMAAMSDMYWLPRYSGKWIENNRAFLDAVRHAIKRIRAIPGICSAFLSRTTVRATTPIRRYQQGCRK